MASLPLLLVLSYPILHKAWTFQTGSLSHPLLETPKSGSNQQLASYLAPASERLFLQAWMETVVGYPPGALRVPPAVPKKEGSQEGICGSKSSHKAQGCEGTLSAHLGS